MRSEYLPIFDRLFKTRNYFNFNYKCIRTIRILFVIYSLEMSYKFVLVMIFVENFI